MVVKWSASLPSTPKIRVQIPLKPTVFSENNKNKQKEAWVGPLLKREREREKLIKTDRKKERRVKETKNKRFKTRIQDERRKDNEKNPVIKSEFSDGTKKFLLKLSIDSKLV